MNKTVNEDIGKPTAADHAAWEFVEGMLFVRGSILLAFDSLDSGHGFYPLFLAAAAQGCSLSDVWEMFRLEPDDVDEIVSWVRFGCSVCGNYPVNCQCKAGDLQGPTGIAASSTGPGNLREMDD